MIIHEHGDLALGEVLAAQVDPLPEAARECHDALAGEEDVVTHQPAQRHRVDGAVELRQRVQYHGLQCRHTTPPAAAFLSHLFVP
jgi:hypothetical protein